MSDNNVIVRFDNVCFEFGEDKVILDDANFSFRNGSKFTIMGQNGAGKSTLLKLLLGQHKPSSGVISLSNDMSIAIQKQVLDKDELLLTTRQYFETAFKTEVPRNLDKLIKDVLGVVNLSVWDNDRLLRDYSGGQKARLLLAHALIQEPDLLLLDEPTNNLDQEGIDHLIGFLMMYDKSCLVISHDSDFLNCFTDGVLYLDVYTKKIDQYTGDYYSVVAEMASKREKEIKLNARMNKQIKDQKDKINFFANKGGKMRKLASKLRDQVAEAEDNIVEVRKDDRTIHNFEIPVQDELSGEILGLPYIEVLKNGVVEEKKANIEFRKGTKMQFHGPNGIGKTTLLDKLANENAPKMRISDDLVIGYYTQDFHNLDFSQTVRRSLVMAMGSDPDAVISQTEEHKVRSVAAGFLIDSELINQKIGSLSEGQKGLVAFAHLVLQKPGLIILDEPTNHINFRHIPVIAKALDQYKGGMILVSHVPDFVSQIKIDKVVDLASL